MAWHRHFRFTDPCHEVRENDHKKSGKVRELKSSWPLGTLFFGFLFCLSCYFFKSASYHKQALASSVFWYDKDLGHWGPFCMTLLPLSGPNTNGCQFYITTIHRAPWIDGSHTIFGVVLEGMEIVRMIEKSQTDKQVTTIENYLSLNRTKNLSNDAFSFLIFEILKWQWFFSDQWYLLIFCSIRLLEYSKLYPYLPANCSTFEIS